MELLMRLNKLLHEKHLALFLAYCTHPINVTFFFNVWREYQRKFPTPLDQMLALLNFFFFPPWPINRTWYDLCPPPQANSYHSPLTHYVQPDTFTYAQGGLLDFEYCHMLFPLPGMCSPQYILSLVFLSSFMPQLNYSSTEMPCLAFL